MPGVNDRGWMVKSAAMSTNPNAHSQIAGDYLADTRPLKPASRKRRFRRKFLVLLMLGLAFFIGFSLFPGRINVLLIGLDRAPEGTSVARSDTLILSSVQPHRSHIAMMSIPRDLWVEIPGVGYNRINAAHFFAEGERAGSGPSAAMLTVEHNFGVGVDDYIRIEFNGLVRFVDALGGVPVTLESPTGKLDAGDHLLSGEQALAFVRDRSGTDDFFRMEHGQQFIQAVLRRVLQPSAWPRLPFAAIEMARSFDSSLNPLETLRFGLTLVLAGPDGIQSHPIPREMTTGFVTDQGAQVLDPDWSRIRPLAQELFGSR